MRPRPCLLGFTQQLQGPGGQSVSSVHYGLSANGELLDDGLRRYRYDPDGRLAAVTTGADDTAPTTRYAHNALGQRTFKTEPLYSPVQGDEADPGFWQSLLDFFAQLWSPATTHAEKLGYAYLYDPSGTLLGEYGTGGANSSGTSEYIHLPTPNGPLPIVALIKGAKHAIHADHLNTPRKLTRANNRVVWQWAYSAFGEEAPTLGADRYTNPESTPGAGTTTIPRVEFNLRYPGQYFDREANLSYNYHRSYDARTGRYTQADPIGLDGGWNRFGYVAGDPLSSSDPTGLFGVPGAIAGGVVGAIGGGLGAAATGGNVFTGAVMGGLGGVVVGGLGPLIGPTVLGQMASRGAAGALGNILGQAQGIGTEGFAGFNLGSTAGSAVGGALGGILAPASYGTQFTGPLTSQVLQRGIAGLPGSAVSTTGGILGNMWGQQCRR